MRRTPRSRKVPQPPSAMAFTTRAPVKGLNDVQPLAAIDPDFALILDNFIAKPEGPTLRQGSRLHMDGITDTAYGDPVDITSFIRYNGRTIGDDRLFGVAGPDIYDLSTGGTIDPDNDAVVSGLDENAAYWEYAQQTYTQAAQNYLIAVNGADAPLIYNGTWDTCTAVQTPAAPGEFSDTDNTGTAVDLTTFNDVIVHQQRLWFVKTGSTVAYYTDIAQAGGKLYAFDFGPFFNRGGALHKLATWTMDAGGTSGMQAALVAISTKGDVTIYTGTNPAVVSDWQNAGTFQLGPPVGKRCTTSSQGELLYLSQDGLYPLSKYLKSSRADDTAAYTYPITNAITKLISVYGTLPGFEIAVFPDQSLLILNIPQPGGGTNFQYVMHLITRGWSRLIGFPALCFTVFHDKLYFGTSGKVYQAFYGGYTDNADLTGSNGLPIVGNALSSFSSFAEQNIDGATKTVVGLKPFFTVQSPIQSISVGINVDFATDGVNSSAVIPVLDAGVATWNNALWNQATWSSTETIGQAFSRWFSPFSRPGTNVATAVSVTAAAPITWAKTQWKVKLGTR